MSAQPRGAELVEDGLLTVAAACRLLSVSRSFLYARMDAGELAYCRLGRSRRLPRRAVLQYAAARLNGSSGTVDGR